MKWKTVKLGELYTVHNGLSKGSKYFGTGYPFLSFSTVFNNYFIPDEMDSLVQSSEKEQKNYSILRGDVFITRTSETSNELGMSCVALKDYPHATYNGFTKRLRPKDTERIYPEYIGYFLREPNFRKQFMAFSSIITRASLKNEDLLRMEVSVPPVNIQKKIAGVLRNYDNLIENNNKRIKILEQMAENLYKEWFVRFRFPGYETAEFVDDLPKGWKVVKLHDYVDIKAGGDRPEICKDTPDDVCNVPIYSNGINNNGLYGYTTDAVIYKESITISARGTVGFVCLRRKPFVPIVRLLVLTPTNEYFSARYLYYLLKNDELIGNGTSQQQITIPMVQKKKVLKPALDVVSRFSTYVKEIWDEIDILQNQNQNLIKQRDYLLPRLMSGKLQVK